MNDSTLAKIADLFETLDEEGIRYCHWKSNWILPSTLKGQTDLDLLVHREDARAFRGILRQLGFAPSVEASFSPLPSVEHHHALDEETSEIVHVHSYYRVITGESLVKNYRLPIEEMLLANTRRMGPVPIPTAGAELIVFTLRMSVKHTSVLELLLLSREITGMYDEAEWLRTDDAVDEAKKLVAEWLPGLDPSVFVEALEALSSPTPLLRRVVASYRVRRRLRSFARRRWIVARLGAAAKFVKLSFYRLSGSRRKLSPLDGGAVIAVVGSDASGKSTTLDHVEKWLRKHYTVRRVHAGKPPSTPLTLLPHWLLPFLRLAMPRQRSTRIEAQLSSQPTTHDKPVSLVFAIRAVMLAYERRQLLVRAHARAASGEIVLCDRYPSSEDGAPDGVKLSYISSEPGDRSLRRRLAEVERRLYGEIPPPDLVIHLSAPLDVTLARNAEREESESEDYVQWRHSLSSGMRFDGAEVCRISTDQPFEDSLVEVKRAIWALLYGDVSFDRELDTP